MDAELTALRARWTLVPRPWGGMEAREHMAVLVRDGRILDVIDDEPQHRLTPDWSSIARTLELRDCILMPGFVNLHNHSLNGPVFRGIVDDLAPRSGTDALVYEVLLPLGDHVSSALSTDDIRSIYRLALLEAVRSGTTTLLEVPRLSHAVVLDVARDMGLRMYLAPYMFSNAPRGVDGNGRPTYEQTDEDAFLKAALTLHDTHDEGARGRIRVGFGPHATDTCSPSLLRRVAEEARDRGTVVTIHTAQSRLEVQAVRDRHGKSPVGYLDSNGCLGPNVVVAHCVYSEPDDLATLRDAGTTVAHCPLTFARSGITVTLEKFLSLGVRTGIGTDAYSFDFFAELRAAGLFSKLRAQDPGVADARALLDAATNAGAAALPGHAGGRIEPGASADLVAVDLSGPHVQPVRDPVKSLVWSAGPSDVKLVMVDGRVILEDGRLSEGREESIVDQAAAAVERLWRSAERAGVLAPTGGSTP